MDISLPPLTPAEESSIKSLHKVLVTKASSSGLLRQYRALFTLRAWAAREPPTALSLAAVHTLGAGLNINNDALLKHEIAYCLGQSGRSIAVSYLKALLEDLEEDPMCRHEAAEAIGALEDTESLDILRKFRDDTNEVDVVRETCEIAVARIEWAANEKVHDSMYGKKSQFASIDPAPAFNAAESIPELRSILLDGSLPLFQRYRAMFALRDLCSPPDLPTAVPAIEALASGFHDPSALFRHEIAFVFGQLSHPASIPSLVATLSNKHEVGMVRHEAAEALGSMGAEDGVEQILRQYLEDSEKVVRDSVIVALDMAEYEKSDEFEYGLIPQEGDIGGDVEDKVNGLCPALVQA